MYDNHFRPGAARLEAHHDTLRLCKIRFDIPRIDKLARRLDALEFTRDPHHPSVGEPVADPVAPADAQIDLGADARDPLRPEPFLQFGGVRPCMENLFGCGGDGAARDEAQHSACPLPAPEMRLEGLKRPVPIFAIMRKPPIGIAQGRSVERAAMHAPVDRALDQFRILKHPQMLRYRRERHIERLRELPDRRGAARKPREQGASRAVGERVKHAVEPLRRRPRGARA